MRTTASIISSLGALSKKWSKRKFAFRKKAAKDLVRRSGFSERMAEALLDTLFSELTAPKLARLLKNELRDPSALDGFAPDKKNNRSVHAKGPQTILHIFSANIPSAAVTSFVLGLLVKSENLGKLSSRDPGFLETYLRSLKAHDQELWSRCRLVAPNDRRKVSDLARRVGLVVAYGNDESLEAIRKQVPAKTPFVGYGHRVSFSLIMKEALVGNGLKLFPTDLAKRTAHDVWMADQRGCLSPVAVFVQKGGAVSAENFAGMLAEELGRLETSEVSKPRRTLSHWLSMRKLRDRIRLAALRGQNAKAWESRPPGLWMVAYDERVDAVFSGGSQVVCVKGFKRLGDLEKAFQRSSSSLQAVALECSHAHRRSLAEWLSCFGVNRICRSGALQRPPLTWHHDGKLNLASWLNWVDLED